MDKASFKEKWKNAVNRKKFQGFVDKYGFYIVLLLCLCIIGATAFLTFDGMPGDGGSTQMDAGEEQDGSNIPAEGPPDNNPEEIDITITDVSNGEQKDPQPNQNAEPVGEPAKGEAGQSKPGTKTDAAEPAEKPADNPTSPDTKKDAAVMASAGAEGDTQDMILPAAGDVTRAYAMDELVYSPTLKEWTTHTGIDISGILGVEVKAALAGTVESIDEDPLKGIVITLMHDNGLKTIYSGLSTKDMVQVGQAVEQGQVISGIGRTASFEITDDPHVHFEVLLHGEYQDPSSYIR